MARPDPPADHDVRMALARLALDGLAMGDAFGGRHFLPPGPDRALPPPPWRHSDDTEMAMAVVEILDRRGEIDRDELAIAFARRYRADPQRGYGQSVRAVLERIADGEPWAASAGKVFGGAGSMGNGGAMRVAPLGAYFADDLDRVIEKARRSAEVTHAHPEGIAGAIAVAIAAAWAASRREVGVSDTGRGLLATASECTPEGETRAGLLRALAIGPESSATEAAAILGNGSRITAPDTVPFALWCAARHIDDFEEALWQAASVGGDNDTNGAIVGGVAILARGRTAIPPRWLESLDNDLLGGFRFELPVDKGVTGCHQWHPGFEKSNRNSRSKTTLTLSRFSNKMF